MKTFVKLFAVFVLFAALFGAFDNSAGEGPGIVDTVWAGCPCPDGSSGCECPPDDPPCDPEEERCDGDN